MLTINFLPDSDLYDLTKPIKEYQDIWSSDGEKILKAWQDLSGYSFKETFINAVVHDSKNGGLSHPLCLKGDASIEVKKAHLVHELGHRVLLLPRRAQYKKTKSPRTSLDNHKIEYLILYDVYETLYGKGFADFAVKYDRDNLPPLYGEAWDFALAFKTKEDRQKKFKEMMAS